MAGTSDAQSGQDALTVAHRQLRGDPEVQFVFEAPPESAPPPDVSGPIIDFLRWIAPFMNLVFWLAVALLAGVVLWMVLREILRRRAAAAPAAASAPEPAAPVFEFAPARARALLAEADRLAGEGRYGEAARVLLHRSIEDIERAHPRSIGPSSTSREIARAAPLPEHGRAAFARIAAAVEKSLFAGAHMDAAAFAECRALYQDFTLGVRA